MSTKSQTVEQLNQRNYSTVKPRRRRASGIDVNMLISLGICFVIAMAFCLSSSRIVHWFVVPVILCGALIGADALDWLRGRLDLLDPVGILGLLGFHFFFVTPFLHVLWQHWSYRPGPPDWRPWLGAMAILNLLGLILYRWCRTLPTRKPAIRTTKKFWKCDKDIFTIVIAFALLASGAGQIWIYHSYGGISGYIAAHSRGLKLFEGRAWLFILSDSFPILAMMGFCVYGKSLRVFRSPLFQAFVLAVMFVLQMIFGGLRGSRSATVWGLFWAVGMIHLYVWPVSRKMIYISAGALFVFMYFYGFYKSAGLDAIKAIESSEYRSFLTRKTGRSSQLLILEDFGRADIQAYILYRVTKPGSSYHLAWGRTYAAALASIVPRAIWPNRPIAKVKEGTEIEGYTYVPRKVESSYVYGLVGEGLLNFGPVIVPLAFACFGLLIGLVRRFMFNLEIGDTRLLIAPFLVYSSVLVLCSDSDNIIFGLVEDGLLPFLIIFLASKRYKLRPIRATQPQQEKVIHSLPDLVFEGAAFE